MRGTFRHALSEWAIVLVGLAVGCSSEETNQPIRNGAVATFTRNPSYQTGGTVTLVFDEARPGDGFQLEFRDFQFMEQGAFDVPLFLGVGGQYLPGAQLTTNAVGYQDTVPPTVAELPPLDNRADGTQVITVPGSFGYAVGDFNSVVLYCRSLGFTVASARF